MNLKIGKVNINQNSCTIIAEAGVNHNCSLLMAEKLIKEAKKGGADIIKFQTYKAEKLVTKKSPRFWKWDKEIKKRGSQYDSYSRLDKFGVEQYYKLVQMCKKYKIEFMSTPFDNEAVDMLYNLGMKGFKIASCDITNFPFLEVVAKRKMPILLSTGASNISEINDAVNIIKRFNNRISIMHCTLCYPTKPKDANLRALIDIKKNFKNNILGLSDHTLGVNIASSSILYGVRVIEKHFTYNKKLLKSADHPISIDTKELKLLRKNVDELINAVGFEEKKVLQCENLTRKLARRSLVSSRIIRKGEKLNLLNITSKRPGTGISPKKFKMIVGKRAKRDIKEDKIIDKNDFC
tara:strand:+ start:6744 stop:7793 length:1050 start_codon:yes stop_codon:yes gene_type:complete